MSATSDDDKRSKATPREVVCTGKVAFDSYARAAAVLKRPQVKSRPGRSTYHCGHCGNWHIGTDKGGVKKQRGNDFKTRKNHD